MSRPRFCCAPAVAALLVSAGFAAAQAPKPVITGGPVNAASYELAGLPNANIAQGSMFILFGQNMGPSTLVNANSFPLPSTLGGTSISVTVGTTTVNAIMLYSLSFQVAAILPSNTPVGAGLVTLTYNNQTSKAMPITVAPSTFGIFTRDEAGVGPAVMFDYVSQTSQPLNALVNAANPGQLVTLWGTGLGPVSGNEAAGPLPGNLNEQVDVFVGNQQVTPQYAGRSGCCAGIDQVQFNLPQNVTGCYVSVAVRVGGSGGVISNFATISVAQNGALCSEPAALTAADLPGLTNGGAPVIGDLGFYRLNANYAFPPPVGTVTGSVDIGNADFEQYAGSLDLLASPRGSVAGLRTGLPSVGSCVVYPFSYSSFFGLIAAGGIDPVNVGYVDAGAAITISGAAGTQSLTRQNQNTGPGPAQYTYSATNKTIGGSLPGFPGAPPALPLFLNAGPFTVNGGGGSVVGPFTANLTVPAASFVWSNQSSLTGASVPRTQNLTVNWTGGSTWVAVYGSSGNPGNGAAAGFECLTNGSAGTFTVPSWVLSALPASTTDSSVGAPAGAISMGTTAGPTRFSASGMNVGFLTLGSLTSTNVVFQ